jgi:hypothetical protein
MAAVRLSDVVLGLECFDQEDTIYASEPWTADSEAIVAREPVTGGLPPDAERHGLKYFLEVAIAHDFVDAWNTELEEPPNLLERCGRLIEYAKNDA